MSTDHGALGARPSNPHDDEAVGARQAACLYRNGTVWTGRHNQTADCVFVVDGVVRALGGRAHEIAATMSEVAEVDLGGGFLMPSFGDGHAHPLLGGSELQGPKIRACRTINEVVEAVRCYAAEHDELSWIVGASYDSGLAPWGLFDARWLDDAVADRPIVLRASDYHTVWCNSLALQLANIRDDSSEPNLGRIPRRNDGSVLGTLQEWGAVDLVERVMPAQGMAQRGAALATATDYFLAHGVTWVQDAWVTPSDAITYIDAARGGSLNMKFDLALYADPQRFATQTRQLAALRRDVDSASTPWLTANTIKFFVDGIVENQTGALLEPYCSCSHDRGMRVWDDLASALCEVDAMGFQVHLHAIGDAAVRESLDAVAEMERVNGPSSRRPVIAHAQLVADQDLTRFAKLGVIANMQPLWAQFDSFTSEHVLPRLGPQRTASQYRLASMRNAGARIAFGSDWPVSSGAPLDGIAVAASRRISANDPAWMPEEVLTVEQAMYAATVAVAEQAGVDQLARPWGEILPGSCADFVWLQHDPREVEPTEICDIPIRATILDGRRVK